MNAAPMAGDLGRFRIEGKIGAGGMGEVYRATDTRLGRVVAIKILPSRLASDPLHRARFEKESRAAAAFNHPNIVTVYDAGIEGAIPWIAMEFVEGETLRSVVTRRRLDTREILEIARPLAGALAKAHEAGIVHRDLKPENIMITADGTPKILDFGLARIAPPNSEATESITSGDGALAGTLGYMAPEQLLGRPSDHRADQFAFGTILYEISTGKHPFRRETGPQTVAAILESAPRLDRTTLPGELSGVVQRCLEKDPARRFASTRDLANELTATLPAGVPLARRPRTRRWAIAGAVSALAIAAGIGTWQLLPVVPATPKVLAIRSFQNLTGDHRFDYYTATMADEIRSRISLISSIRPLGRSAVDRYPASELPRLRKELGAGHLLGGSVQADSEKLRVSVELKDTESSKVVWSRQYERPRMEVADLRSRIALDVADAIKARATPAERARLGRPPTTSREAYDLFLQSKRIQAMDRDTFARRINMLKQAVELDPKFAEAMADMSYLLMLQNDPRLADESAEWARRAVAADPDSPTAHQSLASSYLLKGAYTKARAEYKRAIELDPSNAFALNNLSMFETQLAHFDEGLSLARRSLELNPHHTENYFHATMPLQYIATAAQQRQWLELWRQRFPTHYRVGVTEALLDVEDGDSQAAIDVARKLAEKEKGNIEVEVLLADLAMIRGEPDAEDLLLKSSGGALDPSYSQYAILPESTRARLAWFALQRGDKQGAAKLLNEAERIATESWRSGVEAPGLPIELAAIQAMRGNGDDAGTWFQRAYDLGWRERRHVEVDPMLKMAAGNPRVKAVVQQIGADLDRKAAESTEVKRFFSEVVPSLPPPRTQPK